jgi:phage terminase large subunit-like protein
MVIQTDAPAKISLPTLHELLGSPDTDSLKTQLSVLTRTELLQLHKLVMQTFRRESENRWLTYFDTPECRATYPKQIEWFTLSKSFQELGLFGGNRSGKTIAGTFADSLHLTGLYPEWWPGRRFEHPIDAWAAGDTAKNTRDILQATLLGKPGDPEAFGTGMIPKDRIIRTTVKHGLADSIESIFVRHVTGGTSVIQLKSYDQGREAFQGTSQHLIHLDEEPDIEIYVECLLRLMTTDGILELTATPLRGLTKLMLEFLPHLAPATEPDAKEDMA